MSDEIISAGKIPETVEAHEVKVQPENWNDHEIFRFEENRESLLKESDAVFHENDDLDISYRLGENGNGPLLEVSEYKETIIKNKLDGLERENDVEKELKEKYPESEGYSVESEKPLRDENGNIVRDPETGEYRRIDFVVIKDGKVVDSVEVTSKTADKTEQTAKEERIRENGGNYIKTDDGRLVQVPDDVKTRIERRD